MRRIRMTSRTRTGLALLTMLTAAATAMAAPDNPAAITRAQAHVRQNAALTFFRDDQTFVATDTVTDDDGTEHVRFARSYRGLRVIGGDLVVHSAAGGAFIGLSQPLAAPLTLAPRASLASRGAVRQALATVTGRPAASKAELVIFAREVPTLAYEVVVDGELDDQSPSELHMIVDAASAAILDSWDGVETAGTGKGFFNGTVTLNTTAISGGDSLKDPSRGNQYTMDLKGKQGGNGTLFTDADNVWGDFTLTNPQSVAVDAQYGTAVTRDY